MRFFNVKTNIIPSMKPPLVPLYVLGIVTCLSFVTCVDKHKTDFIPEHYVKELPPPIKEFHGKHSVNLSLQFISLLQIEEMDESIQYSWFYRVIWFDTRLMSTVPDYVQMTEKKAKLLWKPDVIVVNVRAAITNGISRPTVYVGILGNEMYSSTYLIMRVGCPFDYHNYPLDIQVCKIRMVTMGATADETDLRWPSPSFVMDRKRFLKFQDQFQIRLCDDTSKPFFRTKLGVHPQKTLLLILERNYKSYVVQVFLPSLMFVIVAWLSILVPPTMLRTRLLLNSTNLLAIFSMFLAVSKTEAMRKPKVGYLTALNLWMFACVTFVFSSLLLVIFDIHLISVMTAPGASIRAAKRLLNKLQRHRPFQRHRGAASQSNMSMAQLGPLVAATPAERAADPDPATPAAATSAAPAVAEDDGDLFLDASSVTPVRSHELVCTEERLETLVRKRRQLWLQQAAFYERVYLVAFPILLAMFLVCFCYFEWMRHSRLNALIKHAHGRGTAYPGCWCLEDDSWGGCMPEEAYPPPPK